MTWCFDSRSIESWWRANRRIRYHRFDRPRFPHSSWDSKFRGLTACNSSTCLRERVSSGQHYGAQKSSTIPSGALDRSGTEAGHAGARRATINVGDSWDARRARASRCSTAAGRVVAGDGGARAERVGGPEAGLARAAACALTLLQRLLRRSNDLWLLKV